MFPVPLLALSTHSHLAHCTSPNPCSIRPVVNLPTDQRLPHITDPARPVSAETLANLGVLSWHVLVPASSNESQSISEEEDCEVNRVAKKRGYKNRDVINVSRESMGSVYEEKIRGKICTSSPQFSNAEFKFTIPESVIASAYSGPFLGISAARSLFMDSVVLFLWSCLDNDEALTASPTASAPTPASSLSRRLAQPNERGKRIASSVQLSSGPRPPTPRCSKYCCASESDPPRPCCCASDLNHSKCSCANAKSRVACAWCRGCWWRVPVPVLIEADADVDHYVNSTART
ncbi:1,2-dihydroxy-3-keto-5-methylthiopentene dioxygenase [Mycena sanguinolenta]|uniref:1,2-dihydroxy-3-keto-5-methylthiopentene dioxygenase n=1 Tax=Mycena sanguinolenta TaxID=230812 RepID=A0A8H6Y6N5_9AGAR|nr:1,2-dihydroxy-3-keto-5-methylthiopentene dioxygenase [Mycena sanguinolenta]